jgi:16S rRNA (uracil1498-N3)-methyltransferase
LFTGDGKEYSGAVQDVGRRDVAILIDWVGEVHRERAHRLVVAAPMPKGDRGQLLVEKLTELGVTELVLLETARSIRHPGEGKLEKLERWVLEASKQCGRNVLMSIRGPVPWSQLAGGQGLPAVKYLAHPGGSEEFQGGGDLVAAVGPEGGWTEEELALGRSAGWRCVGLGPRILRVETAAITLAARA